PLKSSPDAIRLLQREQLRIPFVARARAESKPDSIVGSLGIVDVDDQPAMFKSTDALVNLLDRSDFLRCDHLGRRPTDERQPVVSAFEADIGIAEPEFPIGLESRG